jgi:peptidoglycan-N-acetylglucosamine deacetylase
MRVFPGTAVMEGNFIDTPPWQAHAGAAPTAGPLRRRAAALLRSAIEGSPLGRRVIWTLPAAANAVALTFDDGPDPEWTPPVLDLLGEHRARATFFLVGEKADRCPELVERIADEGHSVGTHTYSHVNLRKISPGRTRQEIRDAETVVQAITGARPRWFRPPYGAFSPAGLWQTCRAGVTTVLWSVNPTDYKEESSERILAQLGPLNNGDIVLLHDKSRGVVDALPEILARIDDAGLRPVRLDEVFEKRPCP